MPRWTTGGTIAEVLSGGPFVYGTIADAWDSAGRPTTITGLADLTYDALGRMVEQDKSGIYTQIVYDPSGDKLGVMSTTSTLKEAFAALPGGAKAAYNSSGLQLYWHADWLGSWRLSSTPTRSLNSERFYAPYGEQYPSYGSVLTASFAGNDEDTGADLYDAAYREYEIFGRWPSPDPGGTAAANPANPQSWNRYAYVKNNPLLFIDPEGLNSVNVCNTVRATPPDDSQRAAGGGPSDSDEMEAPPPQNGCISHINPEGESDNALFDWSASFGVNGIGTLDGGFNIGNTPGMFTGTSIKGAKPGPGNWLWIPSDTISSLGMTWTDPGEWFQLSAPGQPSNNNPSPQGPGSPQLPQLPTPQQAYKQCMASFQNSTVGQVTSVFSALNFFSNLWEWAGLGGSKVTAVAALDKAEASAAVTNYSVTTGAATDAAPLIGSKILGRISMTAVGAGTAMDAAARLGCHDPAGTASLGAPILFPW